MNCVEKKPVVLTSVPVLVQISYVADCHSKHGVVGPVETDGPSLVVPVTEGVQVHVHSPTNLCLTVKEIRSSNNQICPATRTETENYKLI